MKVRLLLLSGGSGVGQNILQALAQWRDQVHLVATSSIADEPALFAFDTVHLVRRTQHADASFDRRIVELIANERADLVIPCRDDDVRYLAGLGEREPFLAGRLLCGGSVTATALSDKWEGYRFCAAHGLPFAPTFARDSTQSLASFLREQGFPLVAKPSRGWASRDVLLLWNEAQVERALARPGYVLQRFLGARDTLDSYRAAIEADGIPLNHSFMGEKHSVQALVAPDGGVRDVMATRNLKDLRSRTVVRDATASTLAIGERCGRAFSQAGWRGPLNIQCGKDAEGTLWIHEFNGRFTGITADRALVGHNEVTAAITAFTGFAFAGHDVPPPAPVSIASLVSRGADPRCVQRLAAEGRWDRSQ